MTDSVLELQAVSQFYGSRLVFKDVSLRLGAGVHLLAGANGAGKTTLLSIMAGLAKPSLGTVTRKNGCKMALLAHTTFLYPELTALENLGFWAGMHQIAASDAACMNVLERVGLSPYAGVKSGTFSRGMSQRLSLARALLQAPDILFLDEPGTGLDIASMKILRQEITTAGKNGTTVIWISHSLKDDLPLADTLLLLQGKNLAYDGPARNYVLEDSAGGQQ